MDPIQELQQLIEKAWNMRWAQEIEGTVELYTQLQALLNSLPGAETQDLKIAKTETALLWASLLRAQGRQKASAEKLKAIEDSILSDPSCASNRFYFERGLARFVACDYMGACEDFSLFTRKANTPTEQMAGSINKLLCLENMGFETRKSEEECHRILDANRSVTLLPWPQMQRHLQAFIHRKNLKNGNFKEILRSGSSASFDYASYLEQWVRLLPIHADSLAAPSSEITRLMISHHEHLYHKSYRLRTLTFLWHLDDFSGASLSDMSERLYLWVWNWMAHPERVSSEKIGYALKAVAESKSLGMAAPFEAALIRNAIGWLSLFNQDLTHSLRAIIATTQPLLSAQGMPLFDLEYSLIQLLKSGAQYGRKMMDENEALLANHPLWNDESLLFKSLFEDFKSPRLGRLATAAERLRGVVFKDLAKPGEQPGGTLIEVKLTDYSVTDLKSGNSVVSEPLAKAIALLSKKESVPASVLMQECYGIRSFDPFVHNTKLYNLLARVKSALSNIVSVKTKHSVIYTEGAWSRVAVTTLDPIVEVLRDETRTSVAKFAKAGPAQRIPRSPISLLESGKLYSRDELAQVIKGSRATVLRTINKLITEQKLKKKGSSRASRYLVVSKHRSQELAK